MIRCDIDTTYCDNWIVNCKEYDKSTECDKKIQSKVILVLPDVLMELSNLWIKNRIPLNVTKIESDVMLILFNVTMESLNLKKK